MELGQKVSFKKYGADQEGTVSAIRSTSTIVVVTTLEGEQPVTKRDERVEYRVDYTLKNGSEMREWMKSAQLAS